MKYKIIKESYNFIFLIKNKDKITKKAFLGINF